jgi:hypothetical protein
MDITKIQEKQESTKREKWGKSAGQIAGTGEN